MRPTSRFDDPQRTGRAAQAVPKPEAVAIMRSLWLVPLLFACLPTAVDADTRNVSMLVSAYVAPVARVEAVGAPGTVVLTAADLAVGYKDVSAKYRVSHNVARGYMLQFSARAGLTRAIEVRGLGAPVEFGAFGAEVPQFGRSRQADELDLQYRLHLAADARPGVYTMPVTLAANPL